MTEDLQLLEGGWGQLYKCRLQQSSLKKAWGPSGFTKLPVSACCQIGKCQALEASGSVCFHHCITNRLPCLKAKKPPLDRERNPTMFQVPRLTGAFVWILKVWIVAFCTDWNMKQFRTMTSQLALLNQNRIFFFFLNQPFNICILPVCLAKQIKSISPVCHVTLVRLTYD